MSTRPQIEIALDVRSYEEVVVLSNPDSEYDYPASWRRPTPGPKLSSSVSTNSVVLVDRVEVSRRTLSLLGGCRPRVVAFLPSSVEQEKSMRRALTSAYPWSEVWTVFTALGKALVTAGVCGPAYDRDSVVDMTNPAEA